MVTFSNISVSTWNTMISINLNTLSGSYSYLVLDLDKEFTIKPMKDTDS